MKLLTQIIKKELSVKLEYEPSEFELKKCLEFVIGEVEANENTTLADVSLMIHDYVEDEYVKCEHCGRWIYGPDAKTAPNRDWYLCEDCIWEYID